MYLIYVYQNQFAELKSCVQSRFLESPESYKLTYCAYINTTFYQTSKLMSEKKTQQDPPMFAGTVHTPVQEKESNFFQGKYLKTI